MEKTIKVYDVENFSNLLPGIKIVQINKSDSGTIADIESETAALEALNISDTLSCSFCKINFEDNIQQRLHYKSDWHRYNLKQSLKSLEPISEEKFDQLADEVSSISGSDSESETDSSEQDNTAYAINQGKIFFQNGSGHVFSLYRSLLYEKKDVPASDEGVLKLVRQCTRNAYWTILMLGGGHFAGAAYNGSEVLVHKTFHCYTVRAKQGGSQGTRDNKAGGVHPKSAGASLRRYNELSLIQHVADILQTWSPHIEKSTLIFYRAAGPYNRSVLFGGKAPILKKNDSRLRTIPFSTRRPTFTELKRVQDVLSTVEVYSSVESIKTQFATPKSAEDPEGGRQSRRESPRNKNINRAKSRETKERPLPGADTELQSSTDSSDNEEYSLQTENVELSLSDLQPFADTVPHHLRKKPREKKKKLTKKERSKRRESNLRLKLQEMCTGGDLEALKIFFEELKDSSNQVSDDESFLATVNMVIDEHGNTLLHLAALNNKADIILWLLESGASPCNKNDKMHTPYTVNADKEVRNVFRNFAKENPDKYNYPKAQIPVIVSTLTEEEQAEKRKAQRKVKREREKVKKKDNEQKRQEDEDRKRFLQLSDRDKRALAAERRLLAQTSAVLVRCFLCGEDISGKVPFEYSGYRFCSVTCLKAHRMQNPVVLS